MGGRKSASSNPIGDDSYWQHLDRLIELNWSF
jgi:hypothetical protein